MITKEQASQFQILVLSGQLDMSSGLKVHLSQGGYDTILVDQESSFWEKIEQIVPHVLILDLSGLKTLLSEFVHRVNSISSEIAILFITNEEQFLVFSEYSKMNVHDVIYAKLPNLKERVLWSTNRICETIYLNLKNEQLFEELQKSKSQSLEIDPFESTAKVQISEIKPISDLVSDFKLSESKEDILRVLFQNLPDVSLLYFKYTPTMNSFVLIKASMMNHQSQEGVGCALNPDESKELVKNVVLNIIPPTFNQLVTNMFGFQRPILIPLFDGDELEGVFVYDEEISQELVARINDYVSVTEVYYSFYCVSKRVSQLEVIDSVSELYNKKYYSEKLKDEFDRARRLKMPLSVIKLSIDDFEELEKTMGESTRDLIIKSVSGIMNKTGRSNDVACRTGVNEFSVILPHCNRKGASLRAERLRRLIESHTLLENGMRVTVSLGTSEYPSLSADMASLDDSALKSMRFIASKGGNRICIYKAPEDFIPEFEVDENLS